MFRYTSVDTGPNGNLRRLRPFVSPYPSEFYDGVFTDYISHMRTSPYPTDRIEVIAWLKLEDFEKVLLDSGEKWLQPHP